MKEPTPAHEKIRFRRKEIAGWHAYPSADGTPLPDRRRLVPRWLAGMLKWTAIGVTSLIVIVAALLIVIPSTGVESEWLRTQAERAVDDLTGEQVEARIGRTTLALDSRYFLAIGIRDLELSDRETQTRFLTAGRVDLGIRFWPLLGGEVEVASATLADARALPPAGGSGAGGADLIEPDDVLDALFNGLDQLGSQIGPGGLEIARLRNVTLEFAQPGREATPVVIDTGRLQHVGDGTIELEAEIAAAGHTIGLTGEGSAPTPGRRFSVTAKVAERPEVYAFGDTGSLRLGEIELAITGQAGAEGAGPAEVRLTASVADSAVATGSEEFDANARLEFRLTRGAGAFWVERFDLNVARSSFSFSGPITPRLNDEDGNGPVYAFQLIGPRVSLAPQGSPEPALAAVARLTGWISPDWRDIVAEEISIATGQGEVIGSGALELVSGKSPGLSLAVAVPRMPVSHVKNIWPFFAARGARRWALANVFGGWVENTRLLLKIAPGRLTDGEAFGPDEASGHFEVSGARFDVAGSIPPMRDAMGSIDFAGTDVDIALKSGTIFTEGGRTLDAKNGSLKITDAHIQPLIGDVDVEIDGSAAAVAEVASYDPINLSNYLPITPEGLTGTAKGRILASIPLEADIEAKDLEWHLQLDYEGLSLAEPYEGQRIEGASGTIVADRDRADVVAQTKLNGIRGELTLSEPMGDDKSERRRQAKLFLEPGDSEKLFSGLSEVVSGPMTLEVEQLGPGREKVKADLTAATLSLPWIGWQKAKGVAASADFVLERKDGTTELDDFSISGRGFGASGTLAADDNGLARARLAGVAFNPGDSLALAIDRAGGSYTVNVSGERLDARFLIDEFGAALPGTGAGGSSSGSPSVKLDAEIAEIAGHNGEVLVGAKFAYSGTSAEPGIRISAVTPQGARATLVDASAGGSRKVEFKADNAGAVLRFLDVYDKLDGGRAALSLAGGEGPLRGRLEMLDFGLIDEARLQSIVSGSAGGREQSLNQALRRDVDVSRARFNRGSALVEMGANYMRIEDGVVSGPSVGSTFAGTVFDADGNMSITGTFLPAYGINRLFGEIPLLGQLLGNGRGGGLLGVTYRLSGPAKSPSLEVNPLSIVAPGIFRSIFEFR